MRMRRANFVEFMISPTWGMKSVATAGGNVNVQPSSASGTRERQAFTSVEGLATRLNVLYRRVCRPTLPVSVSAATRSPAATRPLLQNVYSFTVCFNTGDVLVV